MSSKQTILPYSRDLVAIKTLNQREARPPTAELPCIRVRLASSGVTLVTVGARDALNRYWEEVKVSVVREETSFDVNRQQPKGVELRVKILRALGEEVYRRPELRSLPLATLLDLLTHKGPPTDDNLRDVIHQSQEHGSAHAVLSYIGSSLDRPTSIDPSRVTLRTRVIVTSAARRAGSRLRVTIDPSLGAGENHVYTSDARDFTFTPSGGCSAHLSCENLTPYGWEDLGWWDVRKTVTPATETLKHLWITGGNGGSYTLDQIWERDGFRDAAGNPIFFG